MELSEAINKRYSCRKYTDKAVDLDILKECVETAHLAPSACNAQPWKFHIIHNEEMKKQFVNLTQPFAKHASFIVVEENKPNLQQRIVNKLKDQEFSQVDIGIACSYLCLRATELGLSTCMTGYFNEPKIKDILNIPDKKRIRLVICIGYGAEESRHFKRKNIEEIMNVL